MNIGFAIITASPFFEGIVRVENELHDKCGFHSRLGLTINIPHTTLFQGSFVENTDYSSIMRKIREFYIDNSKDRVLRFEKVVYMPHGWYFYVCENTNELQKTHMYTLELCKECLQLSPDRMKRNMTDLTHDQVLGIERYGYRYSANAFFPHITIGRNDDDCNEEIIEELTKKTHPLGVVAPVERITVYKMGKDGTHADTLDEIRIL